MSDNREKLNQLADAIDEAGRMGLSMDDPEGVRCIQISDTLAKQITNLLRDASTELSRLGGPNMVITSVIIDAKTLHNSE